MTTALPALAATMFVNAIAPGVIDTPQLAVDAVAAGVSLSQVRADYAAAVVSLLTDPALGAMAGQVVQVNGGTSRGRA